MSSVVRAIILAGSVAACPVLFTGCESRTPVSPSAGTPSAPSASTAEPTKAAAAPAATSVRHVDAAGAKKLLADTPGVVVLDVRTPEEFAAGHVAGAKNLDFNAPEFREHLSKLDRDATYLVHCAAGGRSTRSLTRFQELGFKSVVHLDGGFNGWVQAGQPVAK